LLHKLSNHLGTVILKTTFLFILGFKKQINALFKEVKLHKIAFALRINKKIQFEWYFKIIFGARVSEIF